MSKISKLIVPALLAMSLFTAASSAASPTSTFAIWSWSNLYVAS